MRDPDSGNCDVCGRIVHYPSDSGGLFNQRGGYVCSRCCDLAAETKPACPLCGRPVIAGNYDALCHCDGVTVTRRPTGGTWLPLRKPKRPNP